MENKTLQVGIISGIISSLIVIIFIQPIMSFTWGAVMSIGGVLRQGYIDKIYRHAALADRNLIGHMAFLLLLIIFIFIYINSIHRFSVLNSSMTSSFRILIVSQHLIVLILLVVLFVGFSISSGIMNIRASFNQRLTTLAPAISDAEYKLFNARWVNMLSKADYDAIVSTMDSRAKELGVSLPPVRKP